MAESSFLESAGVFNTSSSKLKLYMEGPFHELLGFVGKDLLCIFCTLSKQPREGIVLKFHGSLACWMTSVSVAGKHSEIQSIMGVASELRR